MACMALPCNFGQTSTSCSNFRNPGVSHTPPQFLLGLGSRQCQPSKGLKFDTPCGNHFVELSRSRGPESRRLQVRCSEAAVSTGAGPVEAQPTSKNVLVAGATGGVGQLVVASLLEKGIKVRALLRNAEKAKALFGDQGDRFEFRIADCRQPDSLDQSVVEGVTHVICCTGTTAFPSKRWDGNNGPEQTDWLAVRNLIDALPSTVEKIILVSSVGVTKSDQLPWNIMNLFGVLKYKKLGEDYLRNSGKTFTIIRPGRLTDGPYTSYDLNTLLKATAGTRRDVIIGQGDKLVGEASRIVVAEACVKALDLDCTNGQTYEISSIEGEGPGKDLDKWKKLFMSAHSTV
ncbi:hypothetical protein MPTK1_1g09850 [Marchantia polymorpha subsp. ruderalis]|uniref:NAD(P)-binding domain-containing protein n=2 Tax=Marchantia polymorpha TaxID=3197 RepID=A0AAF6ANF0_MARPO|nr:hypothetical protein MARPO_0096s0016 [Marchantia polymorpha]BBM97970.1 hypothetical protein Mp_1g09850 [Marchantia polymorpha subsp. ruderalis]|eukprot:PTQ32660.1 hypothetical protein MARPO_0096s0016 [Marchantia polymorpha]